MRNVPAACDLFRPCFRLSRFTPVPSLPANHSWNDKGITRKYQFHPSTQVPAELRVEYGGNRKMAGCVFKTMTRIFRICAVLCLISLFAGASLHAQRSPSARKGSAKSAPAKPGAAAELLPNFSGTLRSISKKSLTLEDQEGNTTQFTCTRKTAYYEGTKKIDSSALTAGSIVSVEARQAPDGSLDAVNVRLEHKDLGH
jgi:hypothetical protein